MSEKENEVTLDSLRKIIFEAKQNLVEQPSRPPEGAGWGPAGPYPTWQEIIDIIHPGERRPPARAFKERPFPEKEYPDLYGRPAMGQKKREWKKKERARCREMAKEEEHFNKHLRPKLQTGREKREDPALHDGSPFMSKKQAEKLGMSIPSPTELAIIGFFGMHVGPLALESHARAGRRGIQLLKDLGRFRYVPWDETRYYSDADWAKKAMKGRLGPEKGGKILGAGAETRRQRIADRLARIKGDDAAARRTIGRSMGATVFAGFEIWATWSEINDLWWKIGPPDGNNWQKYAGLLGQGVVRLLDVSQMYDILKGIILIVTSNDPKETSRQQNAALGQFIGILPSEQKSVETCARPSGAEMYEIGGEHWEAARERRPPWRADIEGYKCWDKDDNEIDCTTDVCKDADDNVIPCYVEGELNPKIDVSWWTLQKTIETIPNPDVVRKEKLQDIPRKPTPSFTEDIKDVITGKIHKKCYLPQKLYYTKGPYKGQWSGEVKCRDGRVVQAQLSPMEQKEKDLRILKSRYDKFDCEGRGGTWDSLARRCSDDPVDPKMFRDPKGAVSKILRKPGRWRDAANPYRILKGKCFRDGGEWDDEKKECIMNQQENLSLEDLKLLVKEVKLQLNEGERYPIDDATKDVHSDNYKRRTISKKTQEFIKPLFIVVHESVTPNHGRTAATFGAKPEKGGERSTHYEVTGEDEEPIRFFLDPEEKQAFHASGVLRGAPSPRHPNGFTPEGGSAKWNINNISIGVDITGCFSDGAETDCAKIKKKAEKPGSPWADAPIGKMKEKQFQKTKQLLMDLIRRHALMGTKVYPGGRSGQLWFKDEDGREYVDYIKLMAALDEGYVIFRHDSFTSMKSCGRNLPLKEIMASAKTDAAKQGKEVGSGDVDIGRSAFVTGESMGKTCPDPSALDDEQDIAIAAACQFFGTRTYEAWQQRAQQFDQPVAGDDISKWNIETGEWPLWLSYYHWNGFKRIDLDFNVCTDTGERTEDGENCAEGTALYSGVLPAWLWFANRGLGSVARDFFDKPSKYKFWQSFNKEGYLAPGTIKGSLRNRGFPKQFIKYIQCGFHLQVPPHELEKCKAMSADESLNYSWPRYVYNKEDLGQRENENRLRRKEYKDDLQDIVKDLKHFASAEKESKAEPIRTLIGRGMTNQVFQYLNSDPDDFDFSAYSDSLSEKEKEKIIKRRRILAINQGKSDFTKDDLGWGDYRTKKMCDGSKTEFVNLPDNVIKRELEWDEDKKECWQVDTLRPTAQNPFEIIAVIGEIWNYPCEDHDWVVDYIYKISKIDIYKLEKRTWKDIQDNWDAKRQKQVWKEIKFDPAKTVVAKEKCKAYSIKKEQEKEYRNKQLGISREWQKPDFDLPWDMEWPKAEVESKVYEEKVKDVVKRNMEENINKIKNNISLLKENLDSERSVKVVLHRNGVVLLLKNENGWDLPGGHVQQTESPIAALEREIYEETGLRLLDQPQYLRGIDHGSQEFYVSAFPRDDISLSDEHLQFGFFTFEECMAKDDLTSSYKDAIKAAMNPESLKDIPSRSTYNQAPAVDSQRGAAGHGGPASHGGVFAPGSGLGGTIR